MYHSFAFGDKSLNIGKGDEVICPDLTFIAPANMIVLSGAKLKLVDINPSSLAIDHKKIEFWICSNFLSRYKKLKLRVILLTLKNILKKCLH